MGRGHRGANADSSKYFMYMLTITDETGESIAAPCLELFVEHALKRKHTVAQHQFHECDEFVLYNMSSIPFCDMWSVRFLLMTLSATGT